MPKKTQEAPREWAAALVRSWDHAYETDYQEGMDALVEDLGKLDPREALALGLALGEASHLAKPEALQALRARIFEPVTADLRAKMMAGREGEDSP
jgi:hypothetical protein